MAEKTVTKTAKAPKLETPKVLKRAKLLPKSTLARRYFGVKPRLDDLPDLIELQTRSYEWFFEEGLRELLDEISPIVDFTGKNLSLSFGDYAVEAPAIDVETAKAKNLTYKAPVRVRASLLNQETGEVKEGDVYLGDFPAMTDRGTFIINGIERVVVSQIVRSYGVLFVQDESSTLSRKLFGAKIIPSRGAWLEIETSAKDVISVKVDRKRRVTITTLLRAFGYTTDEEIKALFADVDTNEDHQFMASTLAKDPAKDEREALVEVYKRIRPGDLATAESAKVFLDALFFNPKRYDLGRVGRYKLNQRLLLDTPNTPENRILRREDLVEIIKEIIRLNNDPNARADDMDSLKNRRIRTVGELVQNKVRVGLLRLERIARDRMAVCDLATVAPAQLINSRPIVAVMQEFFASSQLSQFMNQINPIAELEHKRTLSATGPGGLTRERAGFEVRDVHASHYGRICPIETPEGPNIGLVGYLASYGRINDYGFIETPYRKVAQESGKARVTDEIVYLDAADEERAIIAPASANLDENGYLKESRLVVRRFGEPGMAARKQIQFMDISPMQTVAITTALIPFIEHDEAARSSMGSSMMRQAVPVIRPESPIVGTGIEGPAALDSGQLVLSLEDGTVKQAAGDTIVVTNRAGQDRVYKLEKFIRSNQATALNQRPMVAAGETVKAGQILADSNATDQGELALGQNLLAGFLSWGGYNYEDGIILSERLVQDDRFTSVHIEKYTLEVRDTKLGPEQITRDIPNVGEDAMSNLDEEGVVQIGAEVGPGDILVGKISPKGETEPSAEERLLRAIFGEKAKDVRDSSLRLPHGERGKIVAIKKFEKSKGDELPSGVFQMVEISVAQLRKVSVGDKLAGRHGNKGVIAAILPVEDMPYLPDGRPLDIVLNPHGVGSRMNLGQIFETHLGWAAEKLGYKVAAPVFEGASIETIYEELDKAGLPKGGKITVYDGRTGETYDHQVTVGQKYILKLNHLVDDKVHARSVGPYSMITQQPLGGKAQFGGQRLGEMEVWALEAYGAAHTLQEMLTIKSDDVVGRSRAYESIIKDEPIQKPSIPESFHVLVKELQSLGLSVDLLEAKGEKLEEIAKKELAHAEKIRQVVAETQQTLSDEDEDLEPELALDTGIEDVMPGEGEAEAEPDDEPGAKKKVVAVAGEEI